MKRLVLVLGLVLVFALVFVGCEGTPTVPQKDYVWSAPDGHFKVTIPGGFEAKGEVSDTVNNPNVDVYYFKNEETGEELYTIWETNGESITIDEKAQQTINFNMQRFGYGEPTIGPTSYKGGRYWLQEKTGWAVLVYLGQDPKGNFVHYEYIMKETPNNLTITNLLDKYLTTFVFE